MNKFIKLGLSLLFTCSMCFSLTTPLLAEEESEEPSQIVEQTTDEVNEEEEEPVEEETIEETTETDEEVIETEENEELVEEHTVSMSDELEDTDTLFNGYIEEQMADSLSTPMLYSTGNYGLNGMDDQTLAIYNQLDAFMSDIASGKSDSTFFSATGINFKVTGSFSSKVEMQQDAFARLDQIVEYLSVNSPYEFYWFDKTVGYTDSFSWTTATNYTYYTLKNIYFYFAVADEFALDGADTHTFSYTTAPIETDTDKTGATLTAVTKAKDIAYKARFKDSYNKMLYFKEQICDLTSYNNAAASGNVSYGNPWQMIYVFDGDSTTNVVCEGYSKAFQYLCDLSGITCYTMTGYLNGGGHMWNVVTANDGNNYIVDVTNCDAGTYGYPDKLFLKGATGDASSGYTIGSVTYTYDSNCLALYSDELTVSDTDYTYVADPLPINLSVVELSQDTFTYTGEECHPGLTVTYDTTVLTRNTDYTVQCSNDINAGTATVIITGTGTYYGTITLDYTIDPATVDSSYSIQTIDDQTYTGSEIQPEIIVQKGSTVIDASNYDVTYSNNVNAGTADVLVTFKNNYKGTLSTTFTIDPLDSTDLAVISDFADAVYNGKKQTQSFTVSVNDIVLDPSDYDVTYSNNTNVGTATVKVAFKGNYTGSVSKTFTIDPTPVTVTVNAASKIYGESDPALTASVTGLLNNDTIDYTISRVSGENAGTYTIQASGDTLQGNYQITYVPATFTIGTKSLENVVCDEASNVVYDGMSHKYIPVLKDGYKTLIQDTDYTVSYSTDNFINAKTITVTITGKGNYADSLTRKYKITPAAVTVIADDVSKIYGESDPVLSATVEGLVGQDSIEYSLEREAGESVGSYTIHVQGETKQTNYTVTYEDGVFSVQRKSIESFNVSCKDSDYDGQAHINAPVIKDGDKVLVEGTDYTVTYSDSDFIDVQTVQLTIKGKGNYKGTISTSYDIVIKTPNIASITNATTGLTIKWNKVTGADQYSVYRKDENGWTLLKEKTTALTYTDTSDLSSGTTYTYGIVAYSSSFDAYSEISEASALRLTDPVLNTDKTQSYTAYGGLQISWNKVDGAKGYNVYRKVSGSSKWTQIGATDQCFYLDTTVSANTTYVYTIRAYNGNVKSYYDKTGISVTYIQAPVLKSVTNSATGVTVKWSAVAGATKYAVYRKTVDGEWSKYLTSKCTTTSFVDTTAVSGTNYVYTVRAYVKGWSGKDETGKTIEYLAQPSISSVKNSYEGALVQWSAVEGATSYKVSRKLSGTSKWTVLTVTGKTSYTDTSAVNGQTYDYTIRAVDGDTKSSYNTTGTKLVYVSAPKLKYVKESSKGGYKVYWNIVDGATKYAVYRKTGETGSWTRLTNTCTSSSYLDTTAVQGNRYYYTVRAYDTVWSGYDPVGKCTIE